MKTEVTFRTGTPAPDMTRDELVTWMLGLTNDAHLGVMAGFATSYAVRAMAAHPDRMAITVRDSAGRRYTVTATRTGHWWNRRCTFHATRD